MERSRFNGSICLSRVQAGETVQWEGTESRSNGNSSSGSPMGTGQCSIRARRPWIDLSLSPATYSKRVFVVKRSLLVWKDMFQAAVDAAAETGVSAGTATILTSEAMGRALEKAGGRPLARADWEEVSVRLLLRCRVVVVVVVCV